jgi:hypothetical protein
MALKICVELTAKCDVCGDEIPLDDPIIGRELNTTLGNRPICNTFGSKLAKYTISANVEYLTTCFVVDDDKILCPDCYKKYESMIKSIENEAWNRKQEVIPKLRGNVQ